MNKIFFASMPLLFGMAMFNNSNAASCKFDVPDIKTDVCKDLNLNNKVQDNPFFLTNSNGSCGNGLHLPGLSDLDLNNPLGKYSNGSFCDMALNALSGNEVADKIKELVGL